MITIKLARLYNHPYKIFYEIIKDGESSYANSVEEAKKIVRDAKRKKEKVVLDDSVLDKHNELVDLVNSLNIPKRKK